ncbi:hypothetical protein COO60DRAFT_957430 [Scenedesmus sp. NREL 46B-D3]|nr:hypothetical protein COO60DRAFT_957430 [Scenedesmus sp. NREL 46B-D3]
MYYSTASGKSSNLRALSQVCRAGGCCCTTAHVLLQPVSHAALSHLKLNWRTTQYHTTLLKEQNECGRKGARCYRLSHVANDHHVQPHHKRHVDHTRRCHPRQQVAAEPQSRSCLRSTEFSTQPVYTRQHAAYHPTSPHLSHNRCLSPNRPEPITHLWRPKPPFILHEDHHHMRIACNNSCMMTQHCMHAKDACERATALTKALHASSLAVEGGSMHC